jgi:hypothetical protein
MKALAIALLVSTMTTAVGVARADGDACMSAPVEGQKLQRAGKLLDARARFAACAQKSCPAEIVQDCTRWSQDVSSAIPSVVVAARDGKGQDLLDVRVSIDGAANVVASARAVELDPGAHRFVFHKGGSPDVETDVVVREAAAPIASTPDVASGPRPVPIAAWILGGVGVIALGSFATFGTIGVVHRGDDQCGTGCAPSQKDSVDSQLRIADVSLGVSAVALAIAAWVYFHRPSVAATGSTSAIIDVKAAPGGGVATLGLRF